MFPKAFLLSLALCLAVPGLSFADERAWDVGAVEELNFCLPISILVTPGDSDTTNISVDADSAVAQAFVANVEDGVMGLGLDAGFRTESAVRVTVSVAAMGLKVIRNVGVGDVVIAEGFVADDLTLINAGAGKIVGKGIDVENLVLHHGGAGDLPIFLDGKFGTLDVTVTGFGDIYVLGVEAAANVTINGGSRVHISGGDAMAVTGTIGGLAAGVSVDNGSCELQARSDNATAPDCDMLDADDIPEAPVIEWGCGVEVPGERDCLEAGNIVDTASVDGVANATAEAIEAVAPAIAARVPSGENATANATAFLRVECSEGGDLQIVT